jgi:hypothetical protein
LGKHVVGDVIEIGRRLAEAKKKGGPPVHASFVSHMRFASHFRYPPVASVFDLDATGGLVDEGEMKRPFSRFIVAVCRLV